jgi:LysR family transcriptional regulator, glycine cleavage system transcriptional activator
MARPLPPLNGLRAFEAAARHLSFTRAAEELNVTQAAVSHQIKKLEERLGIRLFRRLNRALMLTDEAQRLYPATRDAFDQLAVAVEGLKARDTVGPLTVSVLPSLATKWLVPRLSRFQERYPDIDLRITALERLVDLVRDDVDIAIRFGSGKWPGVCADLVLEDRLTPVCSPSLLHRLAEPDDLVHVTLLHESMEPMANFPDWATWLRAAGISGVDVSRGLRFSHTHILLQAAIDGRGVALGQMALAAADLAAGRLVAPFSLSLPVGYAYYLVYLPGSADRPKIKAFREWVMSEMADRRPAPA